MSLMIKRSSTSLILMVLVTATPATAQVLFSDSFESGDGSGWGWPGHNRTGYSSEGCQDGAWCGSQTPIRDKCDQSVFWAQNVSYSGQELYVKAWWKFPVGYSFQQSSACRQSNDHKAIILETTTGKNRCFVNFREGWNGDSARIAFICEYTDDKWNYGSGARIVADGKWHSVELHVQRVNSGGAVQAWYDGNKFLDESLTICSGSCPGIEEIKIGAYLNYGPLRDQTFFVDNVTVSTSRIGSSDGGNSPTPPHAAPVLLE